LVAHRAELRASSQAEGLILELACRREQFEDLLNWPYDQPHICEMKMEHLTQNPMVHFRNLFAFWGRLAESVDERQERRQTAVNKTLWRVERRLKQRLPRWRAAKVWPWLIEEVVAANNFRHKSGGRAVGETDADHHYRSGTAGAWRPYFSPALTQQFKAEYNDVLLKLGYEASEEW
jgi:hypothetical protein